MAESAVSESDSLCKYCTLPISDDIAQTELLCSHTVHTRCFIKETCRDSPRYLRCPSCQEALTPEDMLVELGVETSNHSVSNYDIESEADMYDSIRESVQNNPELYADVKNYYEAQRKLGATLPKMKSELARRKRVFNEAIQTLKDTLKQEVFVAKAAAKTAEEYKNHVRATAKLASAERIIHEKYGLRPARVRKAMNGQPGFTHFYKRGRQWRSGLYWIFRRAFCVQIN